MSASSGSDGSTVGTAWTSTRPLPSGAGWAGQDAGDALVGLQDVDGLVGLIRVRDHLEGARGTRAELLLDQVVADPRARSPPGAP